MCNKSTEEEEESKWSSDFTFLQAPLPASLSPTYLPTYLPNLFPTLPSPPLPNLVSSLQYLVGTTIYYNAVFIYLFIYL
jgi:hypothetical protein